MVNLPTSQKRPSENLKVTALNAVAVIHGYPKVTIQTNILTASRALGITAAWYPLTEMLARQLVSC